MNARLKALIGYIFPVLGGLFVTYLYNVVDGIFVGQDEADGSSSKTGLKFIRSSVIIVPANTIMR